MKITFALALLSIFAPARANAQAEAEKTIGRLASPELEGRAPMTHGSELAREFIISQLQQFGIQPAGGDQSNPWVQPVKNAVFQYKIGNNVLGVIPGRRTPDECVYVDAHYDHWGKAGGEIQPGANDNASGVALMLELAEAFSKNPPDRTVVFFASDFEEGALFPQLGAIKGADYHVDHPVCAPQKIRAALVMDTIGGPFVHGMPSHLFLIGSESSRATYELAKIVSDQASNVPVMQLGVYGIEPFGAIAPRADYGAFRKIKVPFIFATSGTPPEYHQPTDTIDKIDFAFMQSAAPQLFKIVAAMASSDFNPTWSEDPSQNIDWDREQATMDRMVDQVLALKNPEPRQAQFFGKLQSLKAELASDIASGQKQKAAAVRQAMQDVVWTILKMNDALHLKDHLWRRHEVSASE